MDYFRIKEKRSLTKDAVIRLLGKELKITEDETLNRTLDFIYALANLAVKIELKKGRPKKERIIKKDLK
ncbi:hypothetical protein [Pedobacter endophyticus]|uniref:Uncharacterized protein n=1 Tax=Pedobacter endophyticus TaxID=2789740 RepID=A0A7S9L192_9SPHI|nr:hypothetical protein [Pedobacter endophyticus]QPH40619.1 hypothetical protein IZT61_04910 [Pedobacter endophyticus]